MIALTTATKQSGYFLLLTIPACDNTHSLHTLLKLYKAAGDMHTYFIQTLKRVGKASHKRCLGPSSTHTHTEGISSVPYPEGAEFAQIETTGDTKCMCMYTCVHTFEL